MEEKLSFSLSGKVVVITGGTGVLGQGFALGVAAAGAKVVVLGRNKERADQCIEKIRQAGGDAMAISADVLVEEQLLNARDLILEHYGTIDALVNAAGGNIPGATIGPDQDLFSTKVADTKKAVDLNLFGTVTPTFIFGEVIARKGKGSIVNISSLAAYRPMTRVLGYAMAKHAIEGFTKWMSIELAQRYGDGVRINAIAPGVFLTEQNRNLLTNPDGTYTDRAQRFVNGTPYGRLGDPQELVGTLIYLLSDASAFVSGTSLLVDGGFNAYSGV